jgi:hypothetical protein
MNLKYKSISEKLVKFDNFSSKNAPFKNINSLLSRKYSPKKLISRHNEQPNTFKRQEYKGKIYIQHIRKNVFRIRNKIRIRNQLKCRILIRKNHSGSTTLQSRKGYRNKQKEIKLGTIVEKNNGISTGNHTLNELKKINLQDDTDSHTDQAL